MSYTESARLRTLYSYAVLDTEPEPNFDRITRLAATIFMLPVCTMSLADANRHWFKSHHGVDATEMPRRMSFCDETLHSTDGFIVPDTLADPRYAEAPVVTGPPGFRFYAGYPLVAPGGQPIGSLCVLDTFPHHHFDTGSMSILAGLAGTVMELLEARSRNVQLARCTAELAHLAGHDPLTGLANRRMLQKQLEDAALTGVANLQAALLYVDLDHFKHVNDSLGHGAGDDLLRDVAARLRAGVRRGDHVARLGGDEFVVLICGEDVRSDALDLAARLLDTIRAPYLIQGRHVQVGASIGVTFVPQLSRRLPHLDELLRHADLALYEAKCGGRGSVRCFEPID